MPQPATLKINDIFSSLQGEGLRQGEPTLFIRFSGCNLHCLFCDTKTAWKEGQEMTVDEILSRVEEVKHRFPSNWICLTGGEPLLQELSPLITMLKKSGYKIQVETNATLYKALNVDWYTISPKPDKYFFKPRYKKIAREVKLVVSRDLSLAQIQKLRKDFPLKTPIILQPQSNLAWSRLKAVNLIRSAAAKGVENIRLSLQIHKILGIK